MDSRVTAHTDYSAGNWIARLLVTSDQKKGRAANHKKKSLNLYRSQQMLQLLRDVQHSFPLGTQTVVYRLYRCLVQLATKRKQLKSVEGKYIYIYICILAAAATA